jgi:adenine phosphoribosyltransferase
MKLEDHIRTIPDYPKSGIQFKDITTLLQDPQAFAYCIDALAEQWQDKQIDAIGMFDARGFVFGAPLAYKLGKPSFPLRKAGKLPYSTIEQSYALEYGSATIAVHTDAIKPGYRVLLVDDLLATGGTMKAGCELVERLGGKVVGCQAIIELSDLPAREVLSGYDVHALVRY